MNANLFANIIYGLAIVVIIIATIVLIIAFSSMSSTSKWTDRCPDGYFLNKLSDGRLVCLGCPPSMVNVVGGCIRGEVGISPDGKCPSGYKKISERQDICVAECPFGVVEYNGTICGKHTMPAK